MKKMLLVFLSMNMAITPAISKAGDTKNQEQTRLQESINNNVIRIDETLAKKDIKLKDTNGNQIGLAEATKQERFIVDMEGRGDGQLEVRRLKAAKDKMSLAIKNILNNSTTLVTIDMNKSLEENIKNIQQSLSIIFPKVFKHVIDNSQIYIVTGVVLAIFGYVASELTAYAGPADSNVRMHQKSKDIEKNLKRGRAMGNVALAGAGLALGTFMLLIADDMLTEYAK